MRRNQSMQYKDTTCSEPRGCRVGRSSRPGPLRKRARSAGTLPAAGGVPNRAHRCQPARACAMTATDCVRAAELLLQARATRQWLEALPNGTRPVTEAEAYAIQDTVARHLGPVVGWKVGS